MRRHLPDCHLPTCWLMTDERMGDDLWTALRRLPPGSGIVFRHHATPPPERARLWRRVRRIARARALLLVIAGDPLPGPLPGADGLHGPHPHTGRFKTQITTRITTHITTWPAHDRAQALAGTRAGAAILFVSPVYPTSSHPGAPALGVPAALRIVRGLAPAIVALGGMTARRGRRLRRFGIHGWAAIDAWLPAR